MFSFATRLMSKLARAFDRQHRLDIIRMGKEIKTLQFLKDFVPTSNKPFYTDPDEPEKVATAAAATSSATVKRQDEIKRILGGEGGYIEQLRADIRRNGSRILALENNTHGSPPESLAGRKTQYGQNADVLTLRKDVKALQGLVEVLRANCEALQKEQRNASEPLLVQPQGSDQGVHKGGNNPAGQINFAGEGGGNQMESSVASITSSSGVIVRRDVAGEIASGLTRRVDNHKQWIGRHTEDLRNLFTWARAMHHLVQKSYGGQGLTVPFPVIGSLAEPSNCISGKAKPTEMPNRTEETCSKVLAAIVPPSDEAIKEDEGSTNVNEWNSGGTPRDWVLVHKELAAVKALLKKVTGSIVSVNKVGPHIGSSERPTSALSNGFMETRSLTRARRPGSSAGFTPGSKGGNRYNNETPLLAGVSFAYRKDPDENEWKCMSCDAVAMDVNSPTLPNRSQSSMGIHPPSRPFSTQTLYAERRKH